MNRIKVKSSNIHSIGLENKILEIKFHNNTIYRFSNVPEKIFINFLESKSKGKFFHKFIKKIYSERRIL